MMNKPATFATLILLSMTAISGCAISPPTIVDNGGRYLLIRNKGLSTIEMETATNNECVNSARTFSLQNAKDIVISCENESKDTVLVQKGEIKNIFTGETVRLRFISRAACDYFAKQMPNTANNPNEVSCD
jgi:hypothetical protein